MQPHIPDTTVQIHASVTLERVLEVHNRRATTLDDPSLCLACGADADSVEPDARNYECGACGECQVFGIEEIVLLFI